MKLCPWAVGWLALVPGLAVAAEATPPRPVRMADRVVEVENFAPNLLAGEIFRESNEVRVRQGVAALKPEPRLAAAADGQAAMLALRIHGGHDNPLANHRDPSARVVQAGLPAGLVGENAATLSARNRDTGRNYTYRELATVIVQAWMDSPGHRANLLSPEFRYLGCGARAAFLQRDNPMVYSIQDFYTPAPRSEPPFSDAVPGGAHLTR